MNKFKLLGLVPLLAAVLVAPLAYADTPVTFNSYQNDQQFLTGRNVTRNQQGFSDPVTATGSELVEVAMYYHNTGGDQTTGIGTPATNTTLSISMPNAATPAGSHTIFGSITADNMATPVTGTVVNGQEMGPHGLTINSDNPATQATTISFVPGSVRWYPDRSDQSGDGSVLPGGQTGDTLVTTGINIGTIDYCWQYSGYIHFEIQVTGVTTPSVTIQTQKTVRKASTNDSFNGSVSANPGMNLEYNIMVRNIDGANPAYNVSLVDALPAGEKYVGPTILHNPDGSTTQLPDGITASGIPILSVLPPNTSVSVSFIVATANNIGNNVCLINQETANASNAAAVQSTAQACFVVVATSTPTPTPIVTPPSVKPTPVLPQTGPADTVVPLGLLSGSSLGVLRYLGLKRKLKRSLRNLDIV